MYNSKTECAECGEEIDNKKWGNETLCALCEVEEERREEEFNFTKLK